MTTTGTFAPLTAYLRAWLHTTPAPGLAVAITDRQRTLYAAGIGYADVAARRPVLLDTTFQIGSIAKSMTALAVMQLVASRRLDLNAPVATHLPWLAIPSPYAPIALRHLLSHTAGLPAGSDFTPAARYEAYALRHTHPAWAPGTRFHYSNTGYKILGWLLEDVTGQNYAAILRRRILAPLRMNDTDAVITHATRHRMAAGCIPLHDDRPYRQGDTLIPAPWMEYAAGDGSVATTASDLARYARLWLNQGRIDDSRALISPATWRMMTAPAIKMAHGNQYQHDYGYGYGIISHYAPADNSADQRSDRHRCHDHHSADHRAADHHPADHHTADHHTADHHSNIHHFIGHGGSTVGFRAIMLADLTDGLATVILCNGGDVDTYAPARYALRFAAAHRDHRPPPEPPPLPDPTRIANPARYAGDYTNPATGATLSVRAAGNRLRLRAGPVAVTLQHIGGSAFVVPDDAFDPFPLRFRPAAEAAGETVTGATMPDEPTPGAVITEAYHGGDVYIRADATQPDTPTANADSSPDPDPRLSPLVGHYRSHAPYVSNFRIIQRRKRLYLTWPNGGEEPLTPEPFTPGSATDPSASFAVGPPGEPTPERLRFDPIVGTRALRIRWAGGGDFYRVD